MSVRDTEKLVKNLQNEKNKPEPANKELDPKLKAIYDELQERMKKSLGTKVTIQSKDGEKGKIEIEYYSQDELDRITELLMNVE